MKDSWKIILLALICFVIGTSEFVIVGVLDRIALSANISIAHAGQLISVFALTVSIGTPVAIYFTAGMNQRKLMMISLTLLTLSCVMMIVFSTYPLYLFSRVIMALGVGVFNVLCFIVATKLAPVGKKGSAIATVTLGFNAALILGLPVGRMVTGIFGWKAIFVFTAVLSLLAVFMVLKFIPAFEGEKPMKFKRQLRLMKNKSIMLSLLMSFFWISGYGVLYAYITPYLQHETGMGDRMLSITFLVFGIATLVGNKTGGYLGDKIGIPKTILIAMTINAFTLFLISALPSSINETFLLLVIWGFAAWLPGPLLRYSIISLAPESQGVILSLYNSILQLGLAVGAGLGGIIIENSGTG
ncbi:MAG: MFS transporter, partial [Ferruginibacter sp.]